MNATMAQMDLMVLQAESKDMTWLDAVVNFTNKNVPPEVVTRLQELWEVTKRIAGQVYEIGKIIVIKIIDFLLANPSLAIGIALGAAIGSLTNMIPFIGPIVAPVAIAVGAFFGAVAGHRLDKIAKGELDAFSGSNIFADAITLAKEFWKHIVEIFQALKEYFEK